MKILKKAFYLTGSALGVLIVSGFLNLQPIAQGPAFAAVHETDPNPCNDMISIGNDATGAPRTTTDPVPSPAASGRTAGIPDSGTFDFNQPAESYQSCLEVTPTTKPLDAPISSVLPVPPFLAKGRFFRGWAWNTNLGYMSMFCDAGLNYGGSCGNVKYGAFMDTANGNVRGFIYGENTGWISMGCDVTGGVGANAGVLCGSKNYGVNVALNDNTPGGSCGASLKKGDLYGYAWSDSVGWINFCGAHADLTLGFTVEIDETGITTGVSGGTEGTGGTGTGGTGTGGTGTGGTGTGGTGTGGAGVTASTGPIYAASDDYYKVSVKISEAGSPLIPATPDRKVIITPTWNNKVRTNQISACGATGQPVCTYDAVKDVLKNEYSTPAAFSWDATDQAYIVKISSSAPTGTDDKIEMTSLRIDIRNSADTILKSFSYGQIGSFEFTAPIQVNKISAVDASGQPSNAFEVSPGVSYPIMLTAEKHGNAADPDVTVHTQLYNCSPNYQAPKQDYDFVFDPEGNGIKDANDNIVDTQDPFKSNDSVYIKPDGSFNPPCAYADIQHDAGFTPTKTTYIYTTMNNDTVSASTTNALGLQTVVQYLYGGKTVYYYSAQKTDGSVINQAALVRGDVTINIVDKTGLPAADKISESIGEKAQSKRKRVLEAVRKALLKEKAKFVADEKIDGDGLRNAPKGIIYLKRKPDAALCNITLDDSNMIKPNQNVTIVSEGCDIYVDSNVVAPADREARLGIIALEDLTMSGGRKGGNLYICGKVTDLEANLVLDGSIFSYGRKNECRGSAMVDAVTGYPKFEEASIKDQLKNQLTLTGSIISNNTYGGSLKNPPILGDGTIANTADKIAASRLYDLNFLRYANIFPAPDADSSDTWAPDVQLSDTLGNPANNIPNNYSIVNIIYDAPSLNQPVFKGIK